MPAAIVRLSALCLLAVLAAAVPAQADEVVRGQLTDLHADHFRAGTATNAFAVRTVGGRAVPVRFRGAPPRVPRGAAVILRGRRARGRVLVSRALVSRSLRPLARAATTGSQSVLVLLVNFVDKATQPFTAAQMSSLMFSAPGSVAAYFAEQSYGKVSLSGDVKGWYTLPDLSTDCSDSAMDTLAADAQQAARSDGVNPDAYDHVAYVFPNTTACDWGGLGELPGRQVWDNGYLSMRILAHELGHNMGMHHASSLACVNGGGVAPLDSHPDPSYCSASEYGDPFDVMGSSPSNDANVFHRAQAGWLDPSNIQTVTASGDYTFASPETLSPSPQLLRIPRDGSWMLDLEARKPYGTYFDTFASTDPAVTGVTVRVDEADITNPWMQSFLVDTTPATPSLRDAPLAAGASLTDPATGTRVTVTAVTALGATVHVDLGSGPDVTAPTQPAPLSATAADGPAVRLSWGASVDDVGVTGYRVERDGRLIATVTGTSLTDGAVVAGGTYGYRVRAMDAAGNLSTAAAATVTVPAPPVVQPPPPPAVTPVPGAGAVASAAAGALASQLGSGAGGLLAGALPVAVTVGRPGVIEVAVVARSGRGSVVLAAATGRATAAGPVRLVLRSTAAGRRLLRAGRSVTATVRVLFAPPRAGAARADAQVVIASAASLRARQRSVARSRRRAASRRPLAA